MNTQEQERIERLTEENSKYHQESIRLKRRIASLERGLEDEEAQESEAPVEPGRFTSNWWVPSKGKAPEGYKAGEMDPDAIREAIRENVGRDIDREFIEETKKRISELEREGTWGDHTYALDGETCLHCGHISGEESNGCPNGKIGMLENRIELLQEDLECVHLWLDDVDAPRNGPVGTYSIVGRMKQLMPKPVQVILPDGAAAPSYSFQDDGASWTPGRGTMRMSVEGTSKLKLDPEPMTVSCDSFKWDGERYVAQGVRILSAEVPDDEIEKCADCGYDGYTQPEKEWQETLDEVSDLRAEVAGHDAALRAAHEAGRVEMRAKVAGVMDGLGEGVVACHSVRDYVIAALDAAGEVE